MANAAENFNVKICKTTVHNLFRKHNITRKVGTRVNHRYKVELGRQYPKALIRSGTFDAEAFCEVLKKLPNGLNLMLDNARIHHARKCLIAKGLPTVAEIAEPKSINLRYTPAYAPHLNPVESVFNTVKNLLRQKEAWTKAALMRELSSLSKTKAFSKEPMTKLFLSVINGGLDLTNVSRCKLTCAEKDQLDLCIRPWDMHLYAQQKHRSQILGAGQVSL